MQEDQWRGNFSPDELEAAAWRLKEVQRRIDEGEKPDTSEW